MRFGLGMTIGRTTPTNFEIRGLYTGQRLEDVASLIWANVDMERQEIQLSTSKTGRQQIIPIIKPLRSYFASAAGGRQRPRAPLFPSAHVYGTRPGGSSPLSQQFHELLVDVGLAQPRPEKWQSQGIGRDAPRKRSGEITFPHMPSSLDHVVSQKKRRRFRGHRARCYRPRKPRRLAALHRYRRRREARGYGQAGEPFFSMKNKTITWVRHRTRRKSRN